MNDDRHEDGGNADRSEDLSGEIRQLEALVEGPAGALAFPALAEAYRRDGRPDRAERVAREGLARTPHGTAGRVALALALLDQKREDEARVELARLLGGGFEDAIARDAAAREAPDEEGGGPSGLSLESPAGSTPPPVAGLGLPIRGELATLDPYPDSVPPWRREADGADAAAEEAPSIAVEPAAQGPFGPPPPPAPARPLVFDEDGVRDDELDEAFDEAEADRDQMLGADDVARAALSSVPEEEDGDEGFDADARASVADGEDELARPATMSGRGAPSADASRDAGPADHDEPIPVADEEALTLADDADEEALTLADHAEEGALALADDADEEALAVADDSDDEDDGGLPGPDSPFATETMAGLLERQGHGDEAARIRERIAERGGRTPAPSDEATATPAHTDPPAPANADDPAPTRATAEPATTDAGAATSASDEAADTAPPRRGGARKQATLERWLDNLRRDHR